MIMNVMYTHFVTQEVIAFNSEANIWITWEVVGFVKWKLTKSNLQ